MPASNFNEGSFTEGQMFDGSSIRGFAAIHESDMKLIPDPSTAYVDPFRKPKTLNINLSIFEPRTGEPYERDPRQVASKAEAYLKATGIADTGTSAPRPSSTSSTRCVYTGAEQGVLLPRLDRGRWNTGRDRGGRQPRLQARLQGRLLPGLAERPLHRPADEMVNKLINAGIKLEMQHHEVGTGGQAEIDYRFDTMTHDGRQAHAVQVHRQDHRRAPARRATFMPKPLFGDNGIGHALPPVALEGRRAAVLRRARLRRPVRHGRWYVGGLLKHAPSVLAFTNPTVNSYHRLVPGFEAPVNLVYSAGNRSACFRIPITGTNPKAKRIEFRVPDPSANPYLAFAAMLMAGLDGIKNKIEPPAPVDKDLYELPPDEAAEIPQVPGSLDEVLDKLEADHEFLLEGGVFTEDLIETWIDYKRTQGDRPGAAAPDPHEFDLYFNC